MKKKEMIPLTTEEKKIHRQQKVCYKCKKGFSTDGDDNKKYFKIRDHCHHTGKYRGAAHDICNLRYKIPKEISVVFHNGWGKIQKNIILFQYHLKKDLTMVNQLHSLQVYW